jgi:hypothetical protein
MELQVVRNSCGWEFHYTIRVAMSLSATLQNERPGDGAVKPVAVNERKISSRVTQELYVFTNKWCNVCAKRSSRILACKQFKNDIRPYLVAHRPCVGHLRLDFGLVGAGTAQGTETSLEERRIA